MFDNDNLPPLEPTPPAEKQICDYDRIQALVDELEALGCAVIVWTPDDYPGATAQDKKAQFAAHSKRLCEHLIERGNEDIALEFGSDDEELTEDDET